MNIVKYKPLNSRFVNWDLGDFFGDFLTDDFWKTNNNIPAVDVKETESKYILEADLPRIKEKDLAITVDKNVLTISSTKNEEQKENKDNYLIKERKNSSFSRRFTLPDNIDAENINASFNNGILTLEIAKVPETKPKTITIKSV